jgi:hypothetical protein
VPSPWHLSSDSGSLACTTCCQLVHHGGADRAACRCLHALSRTGASTRLFATASAVVASQPRTHAPPQQQQLTPLPAAAGPESWMTSNMMAPPAMMNPLMRQAKMKLSEAPPAGCDPDALKLFVGNIPRSYTEEQLQPIFESMGKVVELVVVRDRATHESKGSAFVW